MQQTRTTERTPPSRAAEEILNTLRSELHALETAQRASDEQRSNTTGASFLSSYQSKVHQKKVKTVLGRRALEQHRLRARDEEDEAVEHAARVHDFNTAMREEAAAYIHRVRMQRDLVGSTLPSPMEVYAEHANLELPAAGHLARRDNASKPTMFSDHHHQGFRMGNSVSVIRTIQDLLHDILSSQERASQLRQIGGSNNTNPFSSSNNAMPLSTLSAVEASHDPSFAAAIAVYRPPDIAVDALQRKVNARLERLEEQERQRQRHHELTHVGVVAREDAIVGSRVLRDSVEENQKEELRCAMQGQPGVGAPARVRPSMLPLAAEATRDEQRQLQILAQREKHDHIRAKQRGYVSHLRERLRHLSALDTATEQPEHAPAAVAASSEVTAVPTDPCKPTTAGVVDSGPLTALDEDPCDDTTPSDRGGPEEREETPQTDSNSIKEPPPPPPPLKCRDKTVPFTDKVIDTAPLEQHQHHDDAVPSITPPPNNIEDTPPERHVDAALQRLPYPQRRSRIVELRQLCEQLSREGSDALPTAQARLILALYSEIRMRGVVEVEHDAAATVVQAFVRFRASLLMRATHHTRLSGAVMKIQALFHRPRALHRLHIRQRLRDRFARSGGVMASSMGDVAAVAIQACFRGHLARRPRTPLADRRRRLYVVECAVLIQATVRGFLARRRVQPLRSTWRGLKEAMRRQGDDEFHAECTEGIWL